MPETSLPFVGVFIDGVFAPAADERRFETEDPSTGRVLAEVARGGAADIDAAVASARLAQRDWSALAPSDRAQALRAFAQLIVRDREELARLETLDTGKPLRQAVGDVAVAARYCDFYAAAATALRASSIPLGEHLLDYTVREPLGVSAQIVPWNYPLQIGARGIAAALAAGCSVVVKSAEQAPVTLSRLAALGHEAGLPAGLVNVVPGLGPEAGAALATHPGIDQLTFTGSVATGIGVMQAAATNVVPVVLELGGKSPNIVFADADLAEAAPVIVSAFLQNAGQTCSAGARLLVHRSRHAELCELVTAHLREKRIAPGIEDPDIGPLISRHQLDRVRGMLAEAVAAGVEVVVGGHVAEAAARYGGHYFEPTVLDRVPDSTPIAREEIFGPVLTVHPFEDESEAVELANATDYGLVAGVWTHDVSRAHRVASALRCGQVFVNAFGAAGGVELPFGGYRKSGFGREKGLEGLDSYLQTKNVCVRVAPMPTAPAT